jgi:5-methylcytosine-specific restriction protein A
VVTKALEEIAERLVPGGAEGVTREQRQADALVELAVGSSGKSARPLLVVHTPAESLTNYSHGSEIEGAGAIHPEVVKRVSCDARLQMVLHDPAGKTVGIGHTSRTIPEWLRREVVRRDRGCAFCGTMRYVECHHMIPWPEGPTDLDNLILLCNFHHELVHEGGWRVGLDDRQLPVWFRPDGTRYERAGPKEISSAA